MIEWRLFLMLVIQTNVIHKSQSHRLGFIQTLYLQYKIKLKYLQKK